VSSAGVNVSAILMGCSRTGFTSALASGVKVLNQESRLAQRFSNRRLDGSDLCRRFASLNVGVKLFVHPPRTSRYWVMAGLLVFACRHKLVNRLEAGDQAVLTHDCRSPCLPVLPRYSLKSP
jgi:hypothetical protein